MDIPPDLDHGGGIQDRRASPRIDLPLVTVMRGFDASGKRFEAINALENFSAGGLFMYLRQQPRLGTRLFVSVRLALSRPAAEALHVAARGHVVRMTHEADGRIGVAMHFSQARFLYPCKSSAAAGRQRPFSVITLDPPLQCVHPVPEPEGEKSYRPCSQLAAMGVITLMNGDAWELLPLCRKHAEQLQIINGKVKFN